MEVLVIFMLNVNLHQQKSGQDTGAFSPERPILSFLHCTYSEVFVVYSDILYNFAVDDASSTGGKTTRGSTRLRTISATGLKHVAV
jgi:hypothetical protein